MSASNLELVHEAERFSDDLLLRLFPADAGLAIPGLLAVVAEERVIERNTVLEVVANLVVRRTKRDVVRVDEGTVRIVRNRPDPAE